MSGDNALISRIGAAPRLITGPRQGQRSLYQQQVLDVRISYYFHSLIPLTIRRKTHIQTLYRISSRETFSPTFHTSMQPTTTSLRLRTTTRSSFLIRFDSSLNSLKKRRTGKLKVARKANRQSLGEESSRMSEHRISQYREEGRDRRREHRWEREGGILQ
jgi:hypothetical protein